MRVEEEILDAELRKLFEKQERDMNKRTTRNSPVKAADKKTEPTYTKAGRGRPSVEKTEKRDEAATYMLELFTAGLEHKIKETVETVAASTVAEMEETLLPLIEEATRHRRIEVTSTTGTHVVKGKQHENFERLLKICELRMPSMLVGPAGSGKTHAAEQVAEALGLNFYSISVGAQTSKSDIIGFMNANGTYVPTQFRKAYEEGGIFLMDEIDAGNSNVLIVINAALSGTQAAFPDEMVKKHKDFVFISTANTYGTGANRVYVGRNQLDAATLDRFVTVDWNVDETLEATFVAHIAQGEKWHKVVKAVRKLVNDGGYRVVISPRATIRGAALLDVGLTFEDVVGTVLCSQAPDDQKSRIKSTAESAWRY